MARWQRLNGSQQRLREQFILLLGVPGVGSIDVEEVVCALLLRKRKLQDPLRD
jgi:tRNA A37 threonylcarbamoyladenosine dehydratase